MKIRVIVNPKAGAGSAGRKVPELTQAFRSRGVASEVEETRMPGDATGLSRKARIDGVDLIAVVGGDGTLNEVSRAYVDDSGTPVEGPPIGVIPAGTGGDFRKSFDVGKELDAAVERMLGAAPRPLDLGVLELTSDDGAPVRTTFVNVASFGLSGRVDRLVNESPKWMGGRIAFFVGSLRALGTYRNAPVRIRVDGKPWHEGRVQLGAIANGRFFGGGMEIAPRADPTDGLFDVVVLGDLTVAASLRMTPAVYNGTVLEQPGVSSTRATIVEAEPLGPAPVYIDCDGETPGKLPLRATIAKGAMRIRA
jgi:YegS/Rv2252/BmrU family lipid kinase